MGKIDFVRKKSHSDDVQHWDSNPERMWNSILGDIQTSAGQSFVLWGSEVKETSAQTNLGSTSYWKQGQPQWPPEFSYKPNHFVICGLDLINSAIPVDIDHFQYGFSLLAFIVFAEKWYNINTVLFFYFLYTWKANFQSTINCQNTWWVYKALELSGFDFHTKYLCSSMRL